MNMRPAARCLPRTFVAMANCVLILCACNGSPQDAAVKAPATQAPAVVDGTDALKAIEAVTGIRLPPGTAVVRHERASDSDALVRAKLTMHAQQLSAFLAALSVPNDAFREDKRYLLGTNNGWWNPQDPAALPTAQVPLRGAKVLNLGVDRSDPQQLRVYFLWHGT